MNAYEIKRRQVYIHARENPDASWFAEQLDIVRVVDGKTVQLNVRPELAEAHCQALNNAAAIRDLTRVRNWYGDPI